MTFPRGFVQNEMLKASVMIWTRDAFNQIDYSIIHESKFSISLEDIFYY